jgi:hypothetical protein
VSRIFHNKNPGKVGVISGAANGYDGNCCEEAGAKTGSQQIMGKRSTLSLEIFVLLHGGAPKDYAFPDSIECFKNGGLEFFLDNEADWRD